MRQNNYAEARFKCPFYVRHSDKYARIVCEGFSQSAKLSMNFGKCKRAYREYREDYCESFQYRACPIYRMLSEENG